MTYGDFDREVARRLRETADTTAGQDPFGRRQAILDAADEVAIRTDCLYGERTLAWVENQAQYCLPEFYRVKVILIWDADQEKWADPDLYRTPRAADRYLGPDWRTATPGTVTSVILAGVNAVRVSPAPSADQNPGLLMEGYYQPGSVWKYEEVDGTLTGLDIADDHDCPLPSWAHGAVLAGALYKRAQMDTRPEILRLVPGLLADYNKQRGQVVASVPVYVARANNRKVYG